MANTSNERFLRYTLLLGKGSLFVLRLIVTREVAKGPQTLEIVLENKRRLFSRILREQQQKVFPTSSSVNTDIQSWDISVLYHVLTKLYKRQLNSMERSALNVIKTSRDDIYAHSDEMEMSSDDFKLHLNELKDSLRQLSSGLKPEAKTEIDRIIKDSESGCIDNCSAIQTLKEMNEFETEILNALDRKISNIDDKLTRQTDVLEENMSRLKDISTVQEHSHQDLLDVKRTANDTNTKVQDLDSKLGELLTTMRIRANTEENEAKASRVICDYIKKVKNGNFAEQLDVKDKIAKVVSLDPNVNPELLKAIFDLVDDIINNPDIEIGEVSLGSVLIGLKCSSLRGLLRHMLFMESKACSQRLSEISNAVRHVTGISCSITWTIETQSLQMFLEEFSSTPMTNDSSHSKVVKIPIRYTSLNGLAYVLKLFEDGVLSRHMNRISSIISEEVAEEVDVSFHIDMEQFVSAVLKASPTASYMQAQPDVYYQGYPEAVTSKSTSDRVEFSSIETNDELLAVTVNTVFLSYFALRHLSNLFEFVFTLIKTYLMLKGMQKYYLLSLFVVFLRDLTIRNTVFMLGFVEELNDPGYLGQSELNKSDSLSDYTETSEESETDEDDE